MPNSKVSPLVTVIIPSYNYGRFIGETLESVRRQSYSNWECFVIDDGSTDDTREIVSHYIAMDNRISYVFQPNQGVSIARNNAIKQCRGAYIQFLDADDLLEPGKLEAHVNYLEQYPEIDLVYGDWRHFDSDDPNQRQA